MTATLAEAHEGRPREVDLHLGRRLKLRRIGEGVSQDELARKIGVTFQQIQKYEAGINRLSTSRLWQLSQALKCPISYFYVGLAGVGLEAEHLFENEIGPDSLRLMRAYSQIRDPAVRKRILALAVDLGSLEPDQVKEK